jgi:hypothetical protein
MTTSPDSGANNMVPLALIILIVEGSFPTPESILLKVTYQNLSKEPVRILKYFDDEENLPIWFQVQMSLPDGTPLVDTRGGGKINLRGPLEYITLKPGEAFTFKMNAAKLVNALPEGVYKLRMTYRNQYGQTCFKGELTSNTMEVTVRNRH